MAAFSERLRFKPHLHYSFRMAASTKQTRPFPKTAIAFRPEYLDFRRGIRVGNLEENARITRILKLELEFLYGEAFVTERWGRGVFWRWIGFLPRSNRTAKPISPHVSFGCSKLFLEVDTESQLFSCGLQIERGRLKRGPGGSKFVLQPDWDWHRLMKALRPGHAMERELKRLVGREGFRIHAGSWEQPQAPGWRGVSALRKTLRAAPGDEWAGFQLYYPMTEAEVNATTGLDLVDAMMAVFREVTPFMNLCMQVEIVAR